MKFFKIILCTFCFISLSHFSTAQLKEYDIVEEFAKQPKEKTTIVYLCATWCHPCMEKLKPMIDSFGNNPNCNLVVVFDKLEFSTTMYEKLKPVYNTALLFRFIPDKYYTQKKAIILINGQHKVIKKLTTDYNKRFAAAAKPLDDIWFGKAMIMHNGTPYITRHLDGEGLIKEIKGIIAM